MLNGHFYSVGFEAWFEKSRSTIIFAGVILLIIGLGLWVLKRMNVFQSSLINVNTERGGTKMHPGLREDRKITEYERKKRFVTLVTQIVGLIVFCFFLYILYLSRDSFRYATGLIPITVLYLLLIVAGSEFALFLSNAIICAVFDHVIEMCYANQYRAMQDMPKTHAQPAERIMDEIERGSGEHTGEQNQ